jgi:Fe-S cluster assembly protein SufD
MATTALKESQDVYFASFAQLESRLAGRDPAWLRQIRKQAIDCFGELGFPTTKNEEWKYTSVASIASAEFALAQPAALPTASTIDSFAQPGCSRLVFVNGFYSPELSRMTGLPTAVKLGGLAHRLENDGGLLERHLARHASFENHTFVALNTAFIQDGAVVEIPKGTVVEKPIYLVFATRPGPRPTVAHPRALVLVGRGSQVSFVELHISLDKDVSAGTALKAPSYFTNAVTEIVAEEGAIVDYAKVQQESPAAYHVATLHVQQESSSSVTTHALAFGGLLDREDTRTVLAGEGAESLMHGLYVIGGRQHVDNHTVIDHAAAHCGSRELYKGVLDGHSTGVFNGKIIVRPGAQKTDSKQSNKNLLLSGDAAIYTKPQLEIYADDVKCTHGATIGQIDAEALFYLRSRGIGLADARRLLIQAFATDVLDRIRFEPLRERLRQTLVERLALAGGVEPHEGVGERVSAMEEVG